MKNHNTSKVLATPANAEDERAPRIEITKEHLFALRKILCTMEEAAAFFGCSKRTIMRRLEEPELRQAWVEGEHAGKLSLRRLQWRHAQLQGSAGVSMTIHLSRHWLGETEKSAIEHSGRVDVEVVSARERITGRIAQLASRVGASRHPVGAE